MDVSSYPIELVVRLPGAPVRLPRLTTRRLMVLVAVVALLLWLVILCRPFFQRSAPDAFDALEMLESVPTHPPPPE